MESQLDQTISSTSFGENIGTSTHSDLCERAFALMQITRNGSVKQPICCSSSFNSVPYDAIPFGTQGFVGLRRPRLRPTRGSRRASDHIARAASSDASSPLPLAD